jgi:hypothetical protein
MEPVIGKIRAWFAQRRSDVGTLVPSLDHELGAYACPKCCRRWASFISAPSGLGDRRCLRLWTANAGGQLSAIMVEWTKPGSTEGEHA